MRVLVAMSGGVDSSMAAALLVEQGHDVTGVHLKLADTPSGLPGKGCCTLDDARDARRVADLLGIAYYVWDLSEPFRDRVMDDFVAEYAAGRTPNPCVRCNERVKYTALLARARALGFDALATGHHVRLRHRDGRWRMLRAADPGKDQTYVLYMADQEALAHTRWPVGEYTKPQIREMAAERGLITARKPDSHDICFIPEGDVGGFLEARLGARPGAIVGPDGTLLARHGGAYRFTIGQRRGLGLAGHREPMFVTAIAGDTVTVGPRAALETAGLVAADVSWVAGSPPPAGSPLAAQVRYRGNALPVHWDLTDDGRLHVTFGGEGERQRAGGWGSGGEGERQRAGGWGSGGEGERPYGVAPGQTVALYDGEECVGGATIVSATPARTTADSAARS